jgi:alpha-L-fucosidase
LRSTFATDLAARAHRTWRVTGDRTATLEIDLGAPIELGVVRLAEDITRGQRVARYRVQASEDSDWRDVSRGTTIGYTKLDRVAPGRARRVRVLVEEAVAPPEPMRAELYPR